MDLLTLLFRLPFLPLRGLVSLAEIIRDQAETQLHDPASVRRQLEAVDEAQARGEISEREVAEVQREALDRVITSPGGTAPAGAAKNGRAGGSRSGGKAR